MRSGITWKMTGRVGRRVKRETDKVKKRALQVQFRVIQHSERVEEGCIDREGIEIGLQGRLGGDRGVTGAVEGRKEV